MRALLVALTILMVFAIAGCSGNSVSNTITDTATPILASATIALAPAVVTDATDFPTPTLILPTRRAPAPTKTPNPPAAAPTRTDGIPIPDGATVTKKIPDDVRSYIQGELKGFARLGPAEAYLSPVPTDDIMAQYQADLKGTGWDTVPVNTGLPSGAKLLVAQNAQMRAVIAFVDEGKQTLTYIITTVK